MSAPAILLHDLTAGYDRHPAVHHLSGRFPSGSLTAIVGPNGAGKSTLLKTIVGLIRPSAGRVELGLDRRELAYLPQLAELDRDFPISVGDLVQLGHWHRSGPFRAVGHEGREAGGRALAAVGLEGFARRAIGSLSAGQLQRALFARIIVQDARLILLDEPFAAVDAHTTAELMDLVAGWQAQARTVVIVLHDLGQVRAVCPETLLLARRPIAWGPTAEVLTTGNLLRAWGMGEAWDEAAMPCRVGVPA